MGRICFVHIGLHKTGSTSIQKMLAGREAWLQEQGFHLPRAGRDFAHGHHELAWELNRKRGFAGSAQFDALSCEVEEANFPERIILSSEEFSSNIHLPRVVARLKRKIGRLGYRLHVIAYI